MWIRNNLCGSVTSTTAGVLVRCATPGTRGCGSRSPLRLQTESSSQRAVRCQGSSGRRHTASSSCRDSDTSTWYTGECCSYCREDTTLPVPQESLCPSATPSGCSTVLHVSLDRGDRQPYSPVRPDAVAGSLTLETCVPLYPGPSEPSSGTGVHPDIPPSPPRPW